MATVRRAGDTLGTPDWQLDRMYETDTAKLLEKVYAEDEIPVSDIKAEFSMASYFLGQAVDHLIRAAREAERYGKHKPIDGLIEKLDDDIPYEMSQILTGLKEGA